MTQLDKIQTRAEEILGSISELARQGDEDDTTAAVASFAMMHAAAESALEACALTLKLQTLELKVLREKVEALENKVNQ